MQLRLDFEASVTQRHRREVERLLEQQLLFPAVVVDADVSLHSPWEGLVHFAGDAENGKRWLERIVGPVEQLRGRKFLFDVKHIDRLLYVRPPAKATLDAASLAVARAIWARELGYKPLLVRKHRQRLLASSPGGAERWGQGLEVRDAPWTAIATLAHIGVPLDVQDTAAAALLAEKVGEAGAHIGEAGIAGSTIYISTKQPGVLEGLGIPALAYAGGVGSGQYRLPVLAAEPLLHETAINLSADARAAIKRITGNPRPLEVPPPFPWTLYPFQARDAAKGIRVLEASGGVLFAGEMGSGKALAASTKIVTPRGMVEIRELAVGDEVLGRDGEAYLVEGVFPQGVKQLYRISFSDGTHLDACAEHLWAVFAGESGRVEEVRSTEALMSGGVLDETGKPRWYVPLVDAPLKLGRDSTELCVPYKIGVALGRHKTTHNTGQSGSEWSSSVPCEQKFGPENVRLSVLQGLLDAAGVVVTREAQSSIDFSSHSEEVARDVQWLVESLGGTARVRTVSQRESTEQEEGSSGVGWCVSVRLPSWVREPFRDRAKLASYHSWEKEKPVRGIESIEPAGEKEAVCITVGSPDRLYVTEHAVLTHNTTIALAVAQTLDIWPLLVAAPLSAFSTWARQLGEMGRTFYLASEPTKVAWQKLASEPLPDAVVMSYDRLHAFVELLETLEFKGIIADELQKTSSPGSRRSRALRQLAQSLPMRIGLSGTPMSNYLTDLLPLGSFLVPGEWRPRATSKDLSDVYAGDPVEAVAEHLGAMMVRRRMDDIGVKLPDKNVRRVYVQLTAEQRRALEALQQESQQEIAEGETDRMHVFAKLQKMRQIIACPSMAGVAGPNPKVQTAVRLAEEFAAMGKKSVLFCADRQTWKELGEGCKEAGLGYVGVWGASSVPERLEAERRFHKDDSVQVFIGTIQSCAEALTLSPTGKAWITTSYVYNPATLSQAEARIYRLNQDTAVDIIYLHAQVPGGCLDDRFVEILEAKRALISQVVDRREHIDTTQVHYSTGDLVWMLTGTRDEKLDRMEEDKRAVVKREQQKKNMAKATAHKKKYKNDPDVFRDDGSIGALLDDENVRRSRKSRDDGDARFDDGGDEGEGRP